MEHDEGLFGRQFGVFMQDLKPMSVRRLANSELLRLYLFLMWIIYVTHLGSTIIYHIVYI